MPIYIVDDTIKIEISYEASDLEFEDNIRITFLEHCPDCEKVFIAGETNLFITPHQAEELSKALQKAIALSQKDQLSN
jgi:hypothetical protein